MSMKNPLTLAGIEPATVRFVELFVVLSFITVKFVLRREGRVFCETFEDFDQAVFEA